MKKIIIASALLLAATTSSFGAVKAGKFGMDFSFAGSLGLWQTGGAGQPGNAPSFSGMPTVGFRYHLTDMIAIAPSVGFYTTSHTDNPANTGGTKREYSTTAWGLGLEIPLYLVKFSAMDFYVAPGVGYNPVSSTRNDTNAAGVAQPEQKYSANYLSLYAAVGLQVPINDQLHVFGKTTIGYASGTTNTDKTNEQDDKSTYFGLQSWAVGAIFYFN